MVVSYATLIDVAMVNGLPFPELFPIIVDVGTVAAMIAAAQFRLQGIKGRWLAYGTFGALSILSIIANVTHAGRAADLTLTTPLIAGLFAAVPPAVLLVITHLVMMLIPDEKERMKLAAIRTANTQTLAPSPSAKAAVVGVSATPTAAPAEVSQPLPMLRAVNSAPIEKAVNKSEVEARVRRHFAQEGKVPTGAMVGEWLGGKSAKTGQRLISQMDDAGAFADERIAAIH